MAFPHLLSPLKIASCTLRNRIVSTGHHTYLADNIPGPELIAYHEARARGGAGLIVSEIVAVHETAGFSSDLLKAENRDVIPAYAELVQACHRHGSKIFAQLFHPGREILSAPTGMLPVAWAPSAVPNERFHIMPREMPAALVRDIIAGYGKTAGILADAGFDGFEIVASHGYLPSQFLNPHTNQRNDEYGGDAVRRLRFLRDVIRSIRDKTSTQATGLRISGSELDSTGMPDELIAEVCTTIAPELDYLSITAGTSASLGASVHITAPMGVEHAYMAKTSESIRNSVNIPVLLSGRVNQPQIAEQMIATGMADLCGMTRALICDPQMPAKTMANNTAAIRACIGCNQACIGRAHKGLNISCIQYPESGREKQFGSVANTARRKKILVAGGGPAGMKAAAIAARRGHDVTLFEAKSRLGGQALLAQNLAGREEFATIADNLQYETHEAGVSIKTNTQVTEKLVRELNPDTVVVATGAQPYLPPIEGTDDPQVVSAWEVLQGEVKVGATVAIADWRADWIGAGLAEQFALAGCSVTLCVNAAMACETLQLYARNHIVGRLHKLGITIRTHLRVAGFIDGSAFFEDTLCGQPVELQSIDTLVLALGHQPNDNLGKMIESMNIEHVSIGDCVAARTAEEAVYEGLKTGCSL